MFNKIIQMPKLFKFISGVINNINKFKSLVDSKVYKLQNNRTSYNRA